MSTTALLAPMLAPLLGPLLFFTAAVVLAVRRVRGRRWGHGPFAVMAASVAYTAYGLGLFSGPLWQEPDEYCGLVRGVPGDRVVSHEALPVSVQCMTQDGHGTELVPVWVNPLIYAGLAGAVAVVVLWIRAVARRRTTAGARSR
ncbi:Putative integral membrane protein [Kitasatospora sp. MMS16-BH015]|uniref:hypothetical protein n=1 Tax=Kitasatospora sp. MMS16-BH015 TaxID=2018025 RepID=UPI000CA38E13|nr:hypothetical protein [Kitasatospora sp. MMS16-BH015]AUG79441.1 Putative integral membrane protein [Kitasatospora sp. MMS16-BH015]